MHQHYRFGRLLGKGAYSECYECVDLETEAVVAVKKTLVAKLSALEMDGVAREIKILNDVRLSLPCHRVGASVARALCSPH